MRILPLTSGTYRLLVQALILVIWENKCIPWNAEGTASVLLSQCSNRIVLGRNINWFVFRSLRFSHQNRSPRQIEFRIHQNQIHPIEKYGQTRDGSVNTYPDSDGRDSSQMRRPRESTAVPPSRLEAPETTSAVIGDFQEPKGAVIFSCLASEEVICSRCWLLVFGTLAMSLSRLLIQLKW